MLKKILAAAAFTAVCTGSQAALAFNNNAAFGGGISNNMTSWVQSDNFTLTTAANITGGTLWMEAQGGALDWNGVLQYWIFSGGATPSAVLQSGNLTNLTVTDTGVLAQGGRDNIREVDFDLDVDFAALGGTQYYFGVRAGGNDVAWSGSQPGNSMESFDGTFNNWFNNGRERSFLLNGNANAVPEPGMLGLVSLGLFAAVATRRRKA